LLNETHRNGCAMKNEHELTNLHYAVIYNTTVLFTENSTSGLLQLANW
jgi:hypothetical protein